MNLFIEFIDILLGGNIHLNTFDKRAFIRMMFLRIPKLARSSISSSDRQYLRCFSVCLWLRVVLYLNRNFEIAHPLTLKNRAKSLFQSNKRTNKGRNECNELI